MTDRPKPTMEQRAIFCATYTAAMAEAGYPFERMTLEPETGALLRPAWSPVPLHLQYQALKLARITAGWPYPGPCWACWLEGQTSEEPSHARAASDCATGRRGGCHHPSGPADPPRSLLRRR